MNYKQSQKYDNWTKEDFWNIHTATYLTIYCSKYISVWWDKDKYNWELIKYLKKYCSKYKSIWGTDYIKKVLKNEI